ncbi:hypothetical protein [Natronosalvus caseinilyticus]|uniref:hypothetical protein n=1 Tax=Natronosalvus caseinilyticus TaxID=2953747 RepID=UPI0028AF7475|nr:hypothetical protein [Natronosalvus caseinilyticus]
MDWNALRDACRSLEPGAELVTPVSERAFRITDALEDRLVIQFVDSGEERPLHREQFDVLAEQLEGGPIPLAELPPGVEPYASVLSLSVEHVSDGQTLERAPEEAVAGESPHLVPPEDARTSLERVHDDATLLADQLERLERDGREEPSTLDTETLTDLYVLLSDVQRGSDRVRRTTSGTLLERLGPDQQLHGRFGTVRRTTRDRRQPKDEDVVLDALDEHGIPHEWVLGVDSDKLDVVLAVTDLEPDAVYDVEQQVYVQKTGVDEGEKYSRLQGLAERLEDVDAETAGQIDESLYDDLSDLEQRLEEALSSG